MRAADPPFGWRVVKPCADGGTVFSPQESGRSSESWSQKARRFTDALTPDSLQALASDLGVRTDSLRSIGVGWNRSHDRWTFPESSGDRRIVGIGTRFRNGTKRTMAGSKRGLTVPSDFSSREGVILVVEGPSDVAACLTLGLTAVGRPSNRGGVKHLAKLLDGHEVLIVGENDVKDNGDWPGKKGAESVARQLATIWERPVSWTLPPEGTKDVRQWLNAEARNLDDVEALRTAGADLFGILQSHATQLALKSDDDEPNKSRVTRLVEFASAAELFHDSEGESYATVSIDSHRENMPLMGKAFRRWLSHRYYVATGGAPSGQHLTDAVNAVQAQAVFDGPEFPVYVRVASVSGAIWIDIGDKDWHAIEVNPGGWRVVRNPPVKFLRPRGLLALPIPVSGGSINELRSFLNLASEDDWILVVSAMVAAFRPSGPYIVLVFNGEAGSAKSTACRITRAIIDPNVSALRAEPREARDLMIAARNGWLLCFDNLSKVQPWLSDSLCRLATGGGFSTRELYSNADEILFDSQRPVLLNGIDDLCARGDLADRAVIVTLSPIDDSNRRTEADLWREFETARPRILGALLDAVSQALGNEDSVKLPGHPRMADFSRWACAAAPALGWTAPDFVRVYGDNRAASVALSIESSPIGPALVGLMSQRNEWSGTSADLLAELGGDRHSDERTRQRKDWPGSPRALSGALRRLAPELRRTGIDVSWSRTPGGRRTRLVHIVKTPAEPSRRSRPSPSADPESEPAIDRGDTGRKPDEIEDGQPSREDCDSGTAATVRDEWDGRDDPVRSCSESVPAECDQ